MHEDHGCNCFVYVVSRNSKTPNLNPVADDSITKGGIQGMGAPLYICGKYTDMEFAFMEKQ